jgi:hypothetical protein
MNYINYIITTIFSVPVNCPQSPHSACTAPWSIHQAYSPVWCNDVPFYMKQVHIVQVAVASPVNSWNFCRQNAAQVTELKLIPKQTQSLRGSFLVKALCYKSESRAFETRWDDFFSIYLILPAALGPGVHSAFNRNEYQKQKNNVFGSKALPVLRADNVTAICEPIV